VQVELIRNSCFEEVEAGDPEVMVSNKMYTSSDENSGDKGGCSSVVFTFTVIGRYTIIHPFIYLSTERVLTV